MDFRRLICDSADQRILFLPHAVKQLSGFDRMIKSSEVKLVIRNGEIIEEYHDDPRGANCLILGFGRNGYPIHVVCSPKESYLAIITAYYPDPNLWEKDFKKRRNNEMRIL